MVSQWASLDSAQKAIPASSAARRTAAAGDPVLLPNLLQSCSAGYFAAEADSAAVILSNTLVILQILTKTIKFLCRKTATASVSAW